MKKIILAMMVLASTSAHAGILCKTAPNGTGGYISVEIKDSGDDVIAEITAHGGLSHMIRPLGRFPIVLSHMGADGAVYSNSEKNFELKASLLSGDETVSKGTVNYGEGSDRVNSPVTCSASQN